MTGQEAAVAHTNQMRDVWCFCGLDDVPVLVCVWTCLWGEWFFLSLCRGHKASLPDQGFYEMLMLRGRSSQPCGECQASSRCSGAASIFLKMLLCSAAHNSILLDAIHYFL